MLRHRHGRDQDKAAKKGLGRRRNLTVDGVPTHGDLGREHTRALSVQIELQRKLEWPSWCRNRGACERLHLGVNLRARFRFCVLARPQTAHKHTTDDEEEAPAEARHGRQFIRVYNRVLEPMISCGGTISCFQDTSRVKRRAVI